MTIKEGYIANWKKYPKDEIKVRVARPSILGPSKKLFTDFINWKKEFLRGIGTPPRKISKQEARERAWKACDYEKRFRTEIQQNLIALAKLRELKELAKTIDIRLICYEKEVPCHRFILLDIIKEL